MKEYKVVTVKTPEEAENTMNQYAHDNWEVKSLTYWQTTMAYRLVIVFERVIS